MFNPGDLLAREEEEDVHLHELYSIVRAEEAFLKQKARNTWLELGEPNNRYFDCLIKARQARNTIRCLLDDNGIRREDLTKIEGIILNFYKELLGKPNEEDEVLII